MSAPRLQWSIFEIDRDTGVGADGAGRRPVLVVSRDSANAALPIVTVLPLIDRKPGRRIYPNEVSLPAGTTALKAPAVLMAHQIRTIPKSWLSTRVGSIEDPGLRSAVRNAVRVQLDLEPGTGDQLDVANKQEVAR